MTKTTDAVLIELSIRIRIPASLHARWSTRQLSWGAMLARAQTAAIRALRRAHTILLRPRPFADLGEASAYVQELETKRLSSTRVSAYGNQF